MSASSDTGKFHGKHRVNALALDIGQAEYTDLIGDAIRRAAARHPFGLKHIMRAANANARTVENWTAKRSTPTGLHLLRLMATVPEVQAEVRRLAGMEADLDPMFEQDLHRLINSYQRLQDRR